VAASYLYAEAVTARSQGKLVNVRPADMSFRDIPEPSTSNHIVEAENHERILATIAKVMAGTPIPDARTAARDLLPSAGPSPDRPQATPVAARSTRDQPD